MLALSEGISTRSHQMTRALPIIISNCLQLTRTFTEEPSKRLPLNLHHHMDTFSCLFPALSKWTAWHSKKVSTSLFSLFHLFFALFIEHWNCFYVLYWLYVFWNAIDYMYCYVLYCYVLHWNVIDWMYCYVLYWLYVLLIVIECTVHWFHCYELLFWVHAPLTPVLSSIFQSKYQSSKERESVA